MLAAVSYGIHVVSLLISW